MLYIKNQVATGLKTVAVNLKQFAGQVRRVAEPLNQLSGIAGRAGAALLGPLVAAVTQLEEAKQPLLDIKKALAEGLGRPLLPVLKVLRDVIVRFSEWAKRNPQIIRQVALIGAGLLGVALAAKIAAAGFMLVAGAATIASVAASALAFLFSPAGLIVLGVTALVAAIVAGVIAWAKFTESGKKATTEIGKGIKQLKQIIDDLFKLLVMGEWELVGKIIGQSIRVGFLIELAKLEAILPERLRRIMGFPAFRAALAAEGDLITMRVNALATIAKFDTLGKAGSAKAAHPSQVAQTTHQALALTFGNEPRNALGLTKAQLDELKQIRKLSIAHHKDLIATLRRSGTLRFGP